MTTIAPAERTIAAFTIEMFDTGTPISDTVALAAAAYNVDHATAWEQLCDHLDTLCDHRHPAGIQRRHDAGDLIAEIVGDPSTPDAVIARLATLVADTDLGHRYIRAALTNPSTSRDTLALIADRYGNNLIRISGGLGHPNTSRELIHSVTGNSATASDIKTLLRRDDCDTDLVRWLSERTDSENGAKRLAHRHDLDDDGYQRYAQHRAGTVRCAVAMNHRAPSHVLTQLAGDERDDVRHYVAENPRTPSPVLAALTDDSNQGVAYHAYRQLRERGELTITLTG